jgi:hypothetical protein
MKEAIDNERLKEITNVPVKPKKREIRKWRSGDETSFNCGGEGGGREEFTALKAPRQCQLVLLVKVG